MPTGVELGVELRGRARSELGQELRSGARSDLLGQRGLRGGLEGLEDGLALEAGGRRVAERPQGGRRRVERDDRALDPVVGAHAGSPRDPRDEAILLDVTVVVAAVAAVSG